MELFRRIAAWLGSRRRADDLSAEMEAHRALVQEELERAGLSRDEAARESRRRMGNVTLAREDSRDVWIVRWADQLHRHIRYGLRGLRREPAFALTAILTLGLGTAAITTVFSVADSELWRALPYPDPHRLVAVYSRGPAPRTDVDGVSVTDLANVRSKMPSLSRAAAIGTRTRRTLQLDHAESMMTDEVTANYFSTLGRRAIIGSVFTDEDARGSNAALLTDRGWHRAFNADPGIIGRAITLDGRPLVISGVVADDESFGPEPDLFLPIDESATAPQGQATETVYSLIGRLAGGATADVARGQLQAVVDERAKSDPAWRGHAASADDLSAYYTTGNRRPLYFFLGASVLVLVLTVVNVAGLLLARTLRRGPEFALRGALGGGAPAIALQLMVEAAVIAIPGCLLGLVLTYEAMGLIGAVVPEDFLMRGTHIAVNFRVAAFLFAVTMATVGGLVLAPLGLARRANRVAAIGPGSRAIGLPSAGRSRVFLLTSQLALTVMLLAGAGVFLKSFAALMREPLGFEPADAWSLRVSLGGPRYATAADWRAYADALTEHARAIPGVRDATIATTSPLLSGWAVMAAETGRPKAAPGQTGAAAGLRSIYRAVSSDYFRTVGTRIVRGRGLLATDVAGSPDVAVVNEQFAARMFPEGNAVGRQIDIAGVHTAFVRNGTVTIVGVAADIKEISVSEVKFADVYVPFAQRPAASLELIVRANAGTDPAAMAVALRSAAASVEPAIPVTSVSSLTRRVESSLRGARFNLILVAGFAAVAVLIAAIGIYGAMAYAATARRREFGVRLALGATPRGLVGDALWQAAKIGLAGGAIGLGGALLFAIWLGDALYLVPGQHSGLLFNVKTTDPTALAGALAGVLLIALVAGAIPARRAGRVDPVQALRAE